MLVFAKNPKGIIHTGTHRIYGMQCGRDPVDIPYAVYSYYKNVLVDATYREGYLSKLFKKPFPEIAFKYSELRYVPHVTLNKILTALEVSYEEDWAHKRKVENIKMIIRHGSQTN